MTKTASNPAGLLREVFTSGTDDPQNIEPTLLTLLDQGLLDQAMGELADEADVGDPHATWLWRFIYQRSEEHTSELQSLMRISYAVFCLKKKTTPNVIHTR